MQTAALDAYRQTLDYLYTRLPMFSRIGAAAIKKDLTNTLALCDALGNPHRDIKTIHIAGTNGKGSTSHMLAAIFQHAGYKTGLYTSPHLVDFRERIRINGQPVDEAFVTNFVAANKEVIESIEPSFFEITVVMAFALFAQEEVDIAIIETGLGGRLDSTNVITPELSIITNISLDHTDMLGDTIPAIAAEKAGIIKPGIPVVTGPADMEALAVFEVTALGKGSKLYQSDAVWKVYLKSVSNAVPHLFRVEHKTSGQIFEIQTDLAGNYQQENIATVFMAVEVLAQRGWKISVELAGEALRTVKTATGLRGRWDILQEQPLIIADVAHNPAGLKYVLENWDAVAAGRKHIILGFVKDKDVKKALAVFPKNAHYHFCAAAIPRALSATDLAGVAAGLGLYGVVYSSVAEAVKTVSGVLGNGDALLITGSFFIVGEAMQALETGEAGDATC